MFSIRQMVELTGLSEFTIRGWELRYNAFNPDRTETGRREYEKRDVEKALLLRELLKRGHKISKIAQLKQPVLRRLLEEADGDLLEHELAGAVPPAVAYAMELLAVQKWAELENQIRSQSGKDIASSLANFYLPAIKALSIGVEAGTISIAQEHVFSSFLKEKIYADISGLQAGVSNGKRQSRQGLRFVIAAPEGDHHDIGLLLAHLQIRSSGYASLLLGAHTPAKDLSETALRFDASHILIVATASKRDGAKHDLLAYLSAIQGNVGSHIRLVIAGRQIPASGNELGPSVIALRSFAELGHLLEAKEHRHA